MIAGAVHGAQYYASRHYDVESFFSSNESFNGKHPLLYHYVPFSFTVKDQQCFLNSAPGQGCLVLGEFCQLVGPNLISSWPSSSYKPKELEELLLKVMMADYLHVDHKSEFSCNEPTFVMSCDDEIPYLAFYFTLYDFEARGYVRPFCLVYFSLHVNDIYEKALDVENYMRNFVLYLEKENYHLFRGELYHYLQCLHLSRSRILDELNNKSGYRDQEDEEEMAQRFQSKSEEILYFDATIDEVTRNLEVLNIDSPDPASLPDDKQAEIHVVPAHKGTCVDRALRGIHLLCQLSPFEVNHQFANLAQIIMRVVEGHDGRLVNESFSLSSSHDSLSHSATSQESSGDTISHCSDQTQPGNGTYLSTSHHLFTRSLRWKLPYVQGFSEKSSENFSIAYLREQPLPAWLDDHLYWQGYCLPPCADIFLSALCEESSHCVCLSAVTAAPYGETSRGNQSLSKSLWNFVSIKPHVSAYNDHSSESTSKSWLSICELSSYSKNEIGSHIRQFLLYKSSAILSELIIALMLHRTLLVFGVDSQMVTVLSKALHIFVSNSSLRCKWHAIEWPSLSDVASHAIIGLHRSSTLHPSLCPHYLKPYVCMFDVVEDKIYHGLFKNSEGSFIQTQLNKRRLIQTSSLCSLFAEQVVLFYSRNVYYYLLLLNKVGKLGALRVLRKMGCTLLDIEIIMANGLRTLQRLNQNGIGSPQLKLHSLTNIVFDDKP